MARRLLDLRDVPEDEVADICERLDAAGIAFHRSFPSLLGITAGAIWITDTDRFEAARELHADYQRERGTAARAAFAAAPPSLWAQIRARPGLFVAQLAGLIAAIALATLPFLWLALR